MNTDLQTETQSRGCVQRLVRRQLLSRIESYLGNGGLFNPELMEHDKVRDLLMDCREYMFRKTERTLRQSGQTRGNLKERGMARRLHKGKHES